MPKVTNTKKDTNKQSTNIDTSKDEIIDMLMKKVDELTKLVQSNSFANSVDTQKYTENKQETIVEQEYVEPSPNKQIRIVSLCFGELNLSTEPFGRGKLISFKKFGETKTILYSTLIDIVNNNREFAENGAFYILDKNVVYYLGLTDFYTNLLSKDILDKIYDYSEPEIVDFLKDVSQSQKDSLINNTLEKLFNNVKLDLNKCNIIGKCCGVDILKKLNEMRDIDNALKSK